MRQKEIKTVGDLKEFLSTLDNDIFIISTWEGQLTSINALTDERVVVLDVDGCTDLITFCDKLTKKIKDILCS